MKFQCLLLILLFSVQLNSQFLENFSDGNFTATPSWQGNDNVYIINGELELQNMDIEGNETYLSTSVPTADSTLWEFYFRLAFAPSTSNTMRAYLASDQSNLFEPLHGYFIKVGASGNTDAVELRRQDGENSVLLLSTPEGSAATNPSIRVRVIRNDEFKWELLADLTGENNFTSFGTINDDTYNLGQYFGFANQYTSTRKDKFFFDDIYISPLYEDNDPPSLLSVTSVNSTTIDVLFNEPINQVDAINIDNYSLSPSTTILSANLDNENSNLVHLNISDMVSGTDYTLTINSMSDLEGNTSDAQSLSFFFVETIMAEPNDLIINEIFADPAPVVGLPETEFIELYNRSNNYIDLEGFTLNDATGSSAPFQSFILAPNSYIIICDIEDFVYYQPLGSTIGVEDFPSLNNSGDNLSIKSMENTTIHTVNYLDDWYNDSEKSSGGWTLELINPNLYCLGSENWTASNSPQGGTPGNQNSVFENTLDNTPPNVIDATAINNNSVVLSFSETMNEASILTLNNYTLQPGNDTPTSITLDDERNEVTLTFDISFENEASYTINTNNIFDCVGNEMTISTIAFTFYQITPAMPYDIIINEIMADPSPSHGLPELEYVELYNRSDKNINLEDYTFDEGSSSGNTLPFFILRPDQYVILQKTNEESFESFGSTIHLNNFNLTNGGELLALYDTNGNTIDAVLYHNDWYIDGRDEGYSLERMTPNNVCANNNENWTSSFSGQGGTPGTINSNISETMDEDGPMLEKVYLDRIVPNQIILTFNEALTQESSQNSENYNISPDDLGLNNIYLNAPLNKELTVEFENDVALGDIYQIALSNIEDCLGNTREILNGKFALPDTISQGDIILNEILHNPYTGGSRFVEIYNNSNKVMDIADLYLAKRIGQDSIGYDEVVETPCLIYPKEYIVLTPSPKDIMDRYTVEAPENLMTTKVPSYDNDADAVVLMTTNSLIVDELQYTKAFHNALLSDRNGVSLERISPNLATQSIGNWHSAASIAGFATPTYVNSQFSDETPTSSNNIISFKETTFSPDGDGYQDILNIFYQLPYEGFLANINIYDARGRLIKRLYKQELLANQGSLKWDGSTSDTAKAEIGIYILVAEFIHPNGTTIQEKKDIVVAKKL